MFSCIVRDLFTDFDLVNVCSYCVVLNTLILCFDLSLYCSFLPDLSLSLFFYAEAYCYETINEYLYCNSINNVFLLELSHRLILLERC